MQHYLPKTICVSYMVLNLTESLDSFLNSSTGANRSTNITKPLCKKSIQLNLFIIDGFFRTLNWSGNALWGEKVRYEID